MSLNFDIFADLLFIIMGLGLVIIIPLWAFLTIFTPKPLLEKYFKEPHFTLLETFMLKEFPGSFMRTSIFAWILVLSPYGYRTFRNLHTIRDGMPTWYAFGLRFLIFYNLFTMISIVVLFAILFFYPFPETAS